MDFTSSRIEFEHAGGFSPIVRDYLKSEPLLKSFYEHPVNIQGIAAAIKEREKFGVDRNLLVTELKRQYEGTPLSKEVENNISSLLRENTFTIVTAHQPNIFTGYLYYFYKIIHTVKLSEKLQNHFPDYNFVPVFYMGSEDADFDELGSIYLEGEKITWDTNQKGAVGRMSPRGLEKIISRISGELSIFEYGSELIALLKECYIESADIKTATFRLIDRLFSAYGVVVLIPDNGNLKRVMIDIFKDDLLHQAPSSIVEKTLTNLSAHYKVQANPREINLFYLKEDIRERIVKSNAGWKVVGQDIYFSQEELYRELSEYPERFSPNVILRGLFQEMILPNLAYIGGGGELAYWLELKDLFVHYKIPYPVIILRNSFLIVEQKWSEKIAKLGFEVADFFKEESGLVAEMVKRASALQLDLTSEIREVEMFYIRLKEISGKVDPTLEPHVSALMTQATIKLKALERKLLKAEKKKFEAGQRQIGAIKKALFPGGKLQERVDNFLPYYARYGKNFLKVIYDHSPALDPQFIILKHPQNKEGSLPLL
ncbi:MAG: bacillithiol biosynthesis cysteine-adding enzyme BshC [Chitinophagaceae bacterium]|nr:bacillithiol biosynthesis cysteine-adding enzyme BshC [Chitinophagaceae bacterium]